MSIDGLSNLFKTYTTSDSNTVIHVIQMYKNLLEYNNDKIMIEDYIVDGEKNKVNIDEVFEKIITIYEQNIMHVIYYTLLQAKDEMEYRYQTNIIDGLNMILNKYNTIINTGVFNHQMFESQLIDHIVPNHFITSGSLGTMGSANSMAIGAKIANPNKMVISIDGDQSFNMMNDLKMILNYNVPIKMIIMNDSKQSMVNVWEKLFFNNNITATESINPNYYLLAKAYGIKCINIDKSLSLDHIEKKINKFIEYDNTKPIMLNCIVDSDYCLPLVAPGKGLDEMITYHNFDKLHIDKTNVPS
jgi:thiamine pyrophosphate-dependent acetolactate synthase large subunit-like protein